MSTFLPTRSTYDLVRQYNTITARTPFSTLITGLDVFLYLLFVIKFFYCLKKKKKKEKES